MSVSADNHDRTTKKSSALRCLALVALVEFWEAQKGGHLGALHGSRMVTGDPFGEVYHTAAPAAAPTRTQRWRWISWPSTAAV